MSLLRGFIVLRLYTKSSFDIGGLKFNGPFFLGELKFLFLREEILKSSLSSSFWKATPSLCQKQNEKSHPMPG